MVKDGHTPEFWSFEQAREFVRGLDINNAEEWEAYCKSGEKPASIPSARHVYTNLWKGLDDWLDTGPSETT